MESSIYCDFSLHKLILFPCFFLPLNQPAQTNQPAAAGPSASGVTLPPGSSNADPLSLTEFPPDLISPLSQRVVQCLCDFVIVRKSSKKLYTLAACLIILTSRANSTTKEKMLNYLSFAAGALAQTIATQLSEVTVEVNSLSPSSRRASCTTNVPSITHSASMTRLPDRFGEPGTTVVIGNSRRDGPSSGPGSSSSIAATSVVPPPTGGELELVSLQPLAASQSEQTCFYRILRLVNHLKDPNNDTLLSTPDINVVWERLSGTMECLQDIGDINSSLILQPLVEALCLTQSSSTPTSLFIRQYVTRPRRSNRFLFGGPGGVGLGGNNSISSVIHELIFAAETASADLFPVEPTTPTAPTAPTIEPMAPLSPELQIDLNRPMSPLVAHTREEYACEDNRLSKQPNPSTSSKPNPNDTGFQLSVFANRHRLIINHMLRSYSGNLSESPFAVLLAHPGALDFDVKRRFFRQRFQTIASPYGLLRHDDEPVMVSRERIFEDSYSRLHRLEAKDWKRKFVIRFQSKLVQAQLSLSILTPLSTS